MNQTGDALTPQRTNAISRQLDDELIVYDAESHQAHSLNHTAATVWKSCNGKTKVAEMVAKLQKVLPGIDNRILLVTLIKLQEAGLLTEGASSSRSQVGFPSRRDVIRKMGKAVAVALPVVTSIVVPTPSMALSCFPLGHTCTKNSDCCSNRCGLVGIKLVCL